VTEPIRNDPEARMSPPPVGKKKRYIALPGRLKDLESALKWSEWIVRQVARKNLTAQEAAAMTAAIKEFRTLLDARDADAKLAEAKRVVEEMKALRG
jgi:hypothetical protein